MPSKGDRRIPGLRTESHRNRLRSRHLKQRLKSVGKLPGQAQSMLDEKDPMAMLTGGDSNATTTPNGLAIRRWIDRDYSWAEGVKDFATAAELTSFFADNEIFTSFSLTEERSLLKRRFILDAEVPPLAEEGADTSGMGIKPSTFLQARFTAQLPGALVEHNGMADAQAPGTLVWTFQDEAPTTIHAVSEAWDTCNVTLIGGGALLLLLAAVGGALVASGALNRKTR